MSNVTSIPQLNRELADKVLDDAKTNPNAYPRKYVGIANGKVVVMADNLDELVRRLIQNEPDASKTFWVEIGRDYTDVIEIWEIE